MSLNTQEVLENKFVMHTFARKPLEVVRGEGMHVFDVEGRKYLDFIAGIGAVSLGHCHPAISRAISEQAHKLIHVGNYYYIEQRGEVAQQISALLNAGSDEAAPDPWESFFVNSGAEANECAIKLARLWGRRELGGAATIVTLDGSFHGRTLATLAATAQPAKQEAFSPLPAGFVHVPLNDIDALETIFAEQGNDICAVMVECIQGESGVHPCTHEFLHTVSELTKSHGALLICDEVQSGFYRTGALPFGFQHFGVTPDVVAMAKGIASGFPTGACAARGKAATLFGPGDHGSTFGGSCLAIAAIKATLDVFELDHIGDHVEEVGEYFRTRLAKLPGAKNIRGRGLMCACDIDGMASVLVDRALEEGALISATGPDTLRFLPPLICTTEDVDELMEKLLRLF